MCIHVCVYKCVYIEYLHVCLYMYDSIYIYLCVSLLRIPNILYMLIAK